MSQSCWQRGSCLRLTGPLLGHLDTVSVARDMEAVRVALGDGKLNYLGLSYGTQLGHTYAELYPQNIRVMALDGALDHSLTETSMLVGEATAYERELGRFARWCMKTTASALRGQDVEDVFDRLVQQADEQSLPAAKCATSGTCRRAVTGEDIRFNTQGTLLFKESVLDGLYPSWSELATALAEALAGAGRQPTADRHRSRRATHPHRQRHIRPVHCLSVGLWTPQSD